MCCSGCGNHFSTHGLQSHLLQSNNPACQDEFCKQNWAHLADIADEDVCMEIADDEEHVQAFGGNFFGSDYCPEDFEGLIVTMMPVHHTQTQTQLTTSTIGSLKSFYLSHHLSQRRRGRRKWVLVLSIECKISTCQIL